MALHADIEAHRAEIEAVCRRYHVRELSLFGSALGPDFGPASDFDFLVEFDPTAQVGFIILSGLQNDLSEVLHRKVDVVPKAGLKPLIRDAVLASARVVHAA